MTEGKKTCVNDGCINFYPLREWLDGERECPECRGEDRQPDHVEQDNIVGEIKHW